ncbi:DUF2207 domain-containing protein [Microcella daejeonensis]|uniref:DUF2207 domain-containing protein n=1 Tax=Microcella daejeonensis TaxID=2994971 RepID=A0A9E8S8K1_9MICO|nr:DUF2207 domain-containing protein [Microcella daejeonensis]WAB81004.1 DUF2207 domain-containing protein [Microcella daejeonensis]
MSPTPHRTAALLLLAALALGVVGSVTAGLTAVPVPAQAASSGSVDDFVFDSIEVEYRLDRDARGRATLDVVETLVARFPEADQNRGIRRQIPERYQGRPTGLEVDSVTDERGIARPYSVESEDGVTRVTAAVPEGQFVRGVQTYVITYSLRDAVDAFDDTGAEEFYWDVTGTDWAQPFARVTARVVLGEGLAEALLPERLFCYRGAAGSTDPCPIALEGGTVVATADGQAPYETATVALGFRPGTFTLYDDSYLASPGAVVQVLGGLAAIATAAWAVVLRRGRYRDAPGRPVIVAEYLPPRGLPVMDAALLLHHRNRAVASQLVDLAVRRVITIIETGTGRGGRKRSWRLRLESAEGVEGAERALLEVLFPAGLVPGAEKTLTNSDTTTGTAIQKLLLREDGRMTTRGLRRPVATRHGLGLTALALLALVAMGVGAAIAAGEARGGGLPFALILLAIGGFAVVAVCLYRRPFTAEGSEVRDHLRGLERYIRLAEADRMRVLQSPEGALRDPVDASSRDEQLRLTERLLPWAVLFHHEKQWAEVLGRYADETYQPEWYRGTGSFSVASFSAGVGAMASTVTSSYSGSSSSGGSSGGGSAGGGGGGGGGGGV